MCQRKANMHRRTGEKNEARERKKERKKPVAEGMVTLVE
jgi:hypothetical protein